MSAVPMTPMTANVRRLVFDTSPLWLSLLIFVTLVVAAMNAGWLFNPKFSMPVSIAFTIGPPMIGLVAGKMLIWRALPISQAEMARAQWWIAMGMPIVVLSTVVVIPYLILSMTGHLRAAPLDALSLLGIELAISLAYPTIIVIAQRLSDNFGVAMGISMIPVVIVPMGAAFLHPRSGSGVHPIWLALGALALAVAAAGYRRAEPFVPNVAAYGRGRPRRVEQASGPAMPSPLRGWASLAPSTTLIAAGVGATCVVFYAVLRTFVERDAPSAVILGSSAIPIMIVPMVVGMRARMSLRALRSVGGGPFSLATIIQTTALGSLAVALGVLFLASELLGGSAAQFPMFATILIGVSSFSIALVMRVASIWVFAFSAPLVIAFAMPLAGLVLWKPDLTPFILAGSVAVTLLGWWWTWWELAHGSAAYRPYPFTPQTWRSLGN